MVAQTQENPAPAQNADAPDPSPHPRRGGLRRLIASSVRLADLQYRLWLTQAKFTLVRMALYAALFLGALAFAVLAVIFLCIGVFRILTDVLQVPVWASFLIFGAALGVVAVVLVLIAIRLLSGGRAPDTGPASDEAGGDR